jgi:hypothetical protein
MNPPERMQRTERYRIQAEAAVYYLTFEIVEWLPVFVSEATTGVYSVSSSPLWMILVFAGLLG